MAPGRVEHPQLGVPHRRDFRCVILRHEIEVGPARHDDGARGDCSQGLGEVAAIDVVAADVAVLPRPDLGDQIVGVPVQVVFFPVSHEVLEGLEAQLPVERIGEEVVGVRP